MNRESAREKNIRHGHPSTLHLYWARRPLATARAILFAQLVDDPSSRPDEFPTAEAQEKERMRLHRMIERLVDWDNLNDSALFQEAKDEISKSFGEIMPVILDPFSGGGSIPLEAKRLGLDAHASDLNPLAVLLNKALLEIPSTFTGMKPVFPDSATTQFSWQGTEGLAADVGKYGKLLRNLAFEQIGESFPKITLESGRESHVIAWVWARTVASPNPANPVHIPLVRSWWLSKKKGSESYILPSFVDGEIRYQIRFGAEGPTGAREGTVGRTGGYAISDDTPFTLDYVRKQGRDKKLGRHLIAIIADSPNGRVYLPANEIHLKAADVEKPDGVPQGELPDNPRDFKTPNYGLSTWADLFTNRQLKTLVTFSDLLTAIHVEVLADAQKAGLEIGESLENGGAGAQAYADSICAFLALAISRTSDYGNALNSWHNGKETIRNLFARQAIPMVWDYAESNPFSNSTGNFLGQVDWVSKAIQNAPTAGKGVVTQADASTRDYKGYVISTDPPYYDNIGYADLADFFYVWLRRGLINFFPKTFSTILTPKAEELVADPTRHGSRKAAEDFFVTGFNSVFTRIRMQADLDTPITLYYAYKQHEGDGDGISSKGWHTLLSGLIEAGWEITATWPVRSELANRVIGNGTNVLASSIVLACRPRGESAEVTSRVRFAAALRKELPNALRELMQGTIAPVDLAQAAIGPGISIYSRFAAVREPDGSSMSVKEALSLISFSLDEVLNEQESTFDPVTRFAVTWYKQFGWDEEASGTAELLALSSDTSISELQRNSILTASAGKARLISPAIDELEDYTSLGKDLSPNIWSSTMLAAVALDKRGFDACVVSLKEAASKISLDAVKELGFLLFHEAEKKSRTKDALLFNGLVSAWGEITAKVNAPTIDQGQLQMDFGPENEGLEV